MPPRGSKSLIKQVATIAARDGVNSAARRFGVSPGTINRLQRANTTKNYDIAFKTDRGLERWRERIVKGERRVRPPTNERYYEREYKRSPTPPPTPQARGKTDERARSIVNGLRDRGITDKELAKQLGVSRQKATAMRRQVENGKTKTQAEALRIAKKLQEAGSKAPHIEGGVWVYPEGTKPEGKHTIISKHFKSKSDAQNYIAEIGAGKGYFDIVENEAGDYDIAYHPEDFTNAAAVYNEDDGE